MMDARTVLFSITVIHMEYILLANGGRIFTLYNDLHSWDDTQEVCSRHGQHMLRLKTYRQLEMFNLFMTQWEKDKDLNADVWVGLYDLEPKNGADFVHTWTDGTALGPSLNWEAGEPNNKGEENCVRYTASSKFRTKKCSNLYAAVCETETGCWFTEQQEQAVSGLEVNSTSDHDVEACKTTCLAMDSERRPCVAVGHDGTSCRMYKGSHVYTAISTPRLQQNGQSTVYLKRCYEGRLEDTSAGGSQSSQSHLQITGSSTSGIVDITWSAGTAWSSGGRTTAIDASSSRSVIITGTVIVMSDGVSEISASSLQGMTTQSEGLATSSERMATESDPIAISSEGVPTSSDGLASSNGMATPSQRMATPSTAMTSSPISSNPIATSSDLIATSSNPFATSSNSIATSSDLTVTSSEAMATTSEGRATTSEGMATTSEGMETTSDRMMTKSDGTVPSGEIMKSDGTTSPADTTATDVHIMPSMTDNTPSDSGGTTSASGSYFSATYSRKCVRLSSTRRSNEEMSQLIQELILEKQGLSSTRRKKTSAKDERPAAQNIGKMGIFITILPFVGVVLIDCMRLITFFQSRKRILP